MISGNFVIIIVHVDYFSIWKYVSHSPKVSDILYCSDSHEQVDILYCKHSPPKEV